MACETDVAPSLRMNLETIRQCKSFWKPNRRRLYPGSTSFVATDTDLIEVDQHIYRILINAVSADLLKFFPAVAP